MIYVFQTNSQDGASTDSSGTGSTLVADWAEQPSPSTRKRWRRIKREILKADDMYQAMGMNEKEATKPAAMSLHHVKLPFLTRPMWFDQVSEEIMAEEPLEIGLQVARLFCPIAVLHNHSPF